MSFISRIEDILSTKKYKDDLNRANAKIESLQVIINKDPMDAAIEQFDSLISYNKELSGNLWLFIIVFFVLLTALHTSIYMGPAIYQAYRSHQVNAQPVPTILDTKNDESISDVDHATDEIINKETQSNNQEEEDNNSSLEEIPKGGNDETEQSEDAPKPLLNFVLTENIY